MMVPGPLYQVPGTVPGTGTGTDYLIIWTQHIDTWELLPNERRGTLLGWQAAD